MTTSATQPGVVYTYEVALLEADTKLTTVAGSTLLNIEVLKPSGATDSYTATIVSGQPSKIAYTTTITDLDEAGVWLARAHIIDSAALEYRGDWFSFSITEV
jgi:hypothetical protein